MKYFTREELQCKCGCRLYLLHPSFDIELDQLREQFGHPMVVTSGCRCKRYNVLPRDQGGVGGHPKSLHICDEPAHKNIGQAGLLAVDVATLDGYLRGQLFVTAWRLGWSVGWNGPRKFIHLDRRVMIGLPQTTFDY